MGEETFSKRLPLIKKFPWPRNIAVDQIAASPPRQCVL
jgi:hypothetical protein